MFGAVPIGLRDNPEDVPSLARGKPGDNLVIFMTLKKWVYEQFRRLYEAVRWNAYEHHRPAGTEL